MLLLLARHGNTFEAGDKVVWVGARTDLPLTAKGMDQARALGAALQPMKPRLKRILTGPLERTHAHAEIAAHMLGFEAAVEVDDRLREIDYGLWEGKSSDEIKAVGGEGELRAWDERGLWPQSPGWTPSAEAIAGNVSQLAHQLSTALSASDAALLVTSNGILKFFLKLIPGTFEAMAESRSLKVATGHCCALAYDDAGWQVRFWNCDAAQIAL